jgi:small subunit ribosomal protein S13
MKVRPSVYGLGTSNARQIIKTSGINPDRRVKDLTEAEQTKLRQLIDQKHQVEGDLRRVVSANVKRLKEINAYRGLRHKANLPVHGQRTKTNARTKRGKKITMGSGRKKAAAKT